MVIPFTGRLQNHYPFRARLLLLDEFPGILANSGFQNDIPYSSQNRRLTLEYIMYPKERGEYFFGDIYIFIKTPLQLLIRRKTFLQKNPLRFFRRSFCCVSSNLWLILLNREISAINKSEKPDTAWSLSKSVNMSAAMISAVLIGKRRDRTGGQLMINMYTDEKSQSVYCIIDKGRTMKMAFDGLSLLDYAVNATLAMCSVAITRQDRAGIISFGDKTGNFLPANHRSTQMASIVQTLYNLNTKFLESDFAFLHKLIKTNITQRSLLILIY